MRVVATSTTSTFTRRYSLRIRSRYNAPKYLFSLIPHALSSKTQGFFVEQNEHSILLARHRLKLRIVLEKGANVCWGCSRLEEAIK